MTNNKTTALLRALVNRLDDIDQLLLILQHPVELVIVSGSEIAHHVFVAVEEEEGHWVLLWLAGCFSSTVLSRVGRGSYVKLVHNVEFWNFVDVAKVDYRKVWRNISDS